MRQPIERQVYGPLGLEKVVLGYEETWGDDIWEEAESALESPEEELSLSKIMKRWEEEDPEERWRRENEERHML
jgi:hypothetical protein